MSAGVQLCPSCRAEYTLVVSRCAECDVELVAPDQVPEEAPPPELPVAAELTCVRVAPLAWVQALSTGLQQRGISHRIEPAQAADAPADQRPDVFGDVQLFGVYLPDADAAPARELDTLIAARLLPEEAPALDDGEAESCPACGTSLGAHETECPDCGLRLD